jgi:hypothetical protein
MVQTGASLPAPPPDGHLAAVVCFTQTSCLAVGHSGSAPLVEQLSGSTWSVKSAPVPPGATSAAFTSIACFGTTYCDAVGSYTDSSGDVHTLAEQRNGTTWSVQTSPDASGAGVSQLQSVTCTGVGTCLASGYSSTGPGTARSLLMERLNGSWSIESIPMPSGSSSSELDTVRCFFRASGKNLCMAVGEADSKSLAEYFDGTTWMLQTTVNPVGAGAGANGHLFSVSCPAKLFCMAVGSYTDGTGTKTFGETWNGTTWKLSNTRSTAQTENELPSVTCYSKFACIAVGDIGGATGPRHTLVERWTEKTWAVETTPLPPGGGGPPALAGVTCGSTGWCVAVGTQEIGGSSPSNNAASEARSTSGTWTVLDTPTPSGASGQLNGVSCSSADRCTAVGSFGTGDSASPFAERWNGVKWTFQDVPTSGGSDTLNAVSCPSSTFCMAAGVATGANSAFVEEYFGSTWTVLPTPGFGTGETGGLDAVSCTSSNACEAVGQTSSGLTSTALIERWNGSTWSLQTSPTGTSFAGLSGVSCTGSGQCTAVGHTESAAGSEVFLIIRLHGTVWTRQKSVGNPSLGSVSCATSLACRSAPQMPRGQTAGALFWDGTTWSDETLPIPRPVGAATLNGIDCPTSSVCTIVGSLNVGGGAYNTLVFTSSGSTWSEQTTPSPSSQSTLNGVSCLPDTTCVAVGSSNGQPLIEGNDLPG